VEPKVANKIVLDGMIDSISDETVCIVLKKDLKLERGKHGHIHTDFRDDANGGKGEDTRYSANKLQLVSVLLGKSQDLGLQVGRAKCRFCYLTFANTDLWLPLVALFAMLFLSAVNLHLFRALFPFVPLGLFAVHIRTLRHGLLYHVGGFLSFRLRGALHVLLHFYIKY